MKDLSSLTKDQTHAPCNPLDCQESLIEHFKFLLSPCCFWVELFCKANHSLILALWSQFCALYNTLHHGSPIFLVNLLMCCEHMKNFSRYCI